MELSSARPNPADADERVAFEKGSGAQKWGRWAFYSICKNWPATFAGAAVGALLTVAAFHFVQFKYEAELVIAPAQQDAGLSKNLAGLASIAGVNLPKGQAVSPFALYLELLRGTTVAAAVQKDEGLLIRLFPGRFDPETRTWRRAPGFVPVFARSVTSVLGLGYEWPERPSVAEVQRYLGQNLAIIENRRDSTARLGFVSTDRDLAETLLIKVHSAADDHMRLKSLQRANAYTTYLNEQIATVQIAELRRALSDTLADQEKQRMSAMSGLPFAADPVGGVSVSARPTRPSPILLLIVGAAGSLFAGALLAILAQSRRDRRAMPV